jgi:porin
MLYQQASDSLPGQDDDALGYIFRQQGSWTLVGRNGGNTGRIEWRLESRANAGNMQSPSQLGGAIGAGPLGSGFGYSQDFDLDLAVVNWTQGFNNNKAGFAVGRLGFDAYLDAFPFQTLSKGFINRGFILNPTMGTTGIGAIGAVTRVFLGDNVWIGAQMHDANAMSGDFDFDTTREGEWLKAVEIGFTPSFAERKNRLLQISYWEKDARELAGTAKGSGWVVSTAWQMSERLFPFVRYGNSDGGAGVPAEQSIAAGIQITQAHDNAISLGLSWAEPSEETYGPGRDNEWVVEASWKFQMSKNFSLSPDIQLIRNPVNNPDESSVWVFGLRGILTL